MYLCIVDYDFDFEPLFLPLLHAYLNYSVQIGILEILSQSGRFVVRRTQNLSKQPGYYDFVSILFSIPRLFQQIMPLAQIRHNILARHSNRQRWLAHWLDSPQVPPMNYTHQKFLSARVILQTTRLSSKANRSPQASKGYSNKTVIHYF